MRTSKTEQCEMTTVEMTTHVDANGVLHLDVPLGIDAANREVKVTIRPATITPAKSPPKTKEEFFEHGFFRVAGCDASSLPSLTSGHRADNQERLSAVDDRGGQLGFRRFEGQIFFASEKPDERPAFQRNVVANRPAQHRIACFERVEDRAQRDRPLDLKLQLAVNACQRAQVIGKHNSDHGNVWTSTDRTGGRCRTTGLQVSPLSAEA